MELIACICVHNVCMHAANVLHRLNKYTVKETRYYMHRKKVMYAIYLRRFGDALIQHIYGDMSMPISSTIFRNFSISMAMIHLPLLCPIGTLLIDITIHATTTIYMPSAVISTASIITDGKCNASVSMLQRTKPGLIKYRMRLPTRYNPVSWDRTYTHSISLAKNHVGVRPDCELRKIITGIKVKYIDAPLHLTSPWARDLFIHRYYDDYVYVTS